MAIAGHPSTILPELEVIAPGSLVTGGVAQPEQVPIYCFEHDFVTTPGAKPWPRVLVFLVSVVQVLPAHERRSPQRIKRAFFADQPP